MKTVYVDDATHGVLRKLAFDAGVSMGSYVRMVLAGEAVGTAKSGGAASCNAGASRATPDDGRLPEGFESPPATILQPAAQHAGSQSGLAPPVQSNGATLATLLKYEPCRDCQRMLEFPERRGPEHKRACGLWREA